MQSTSLPPQSEGLALVSRSAGDDRPGFQGTIASACDAGIGVDHFIAMVRLARASDPDAARFLDAWDAASGEPSGRTADAICGQLGIVPLDLLKAAASATIRFSTYTAQILAAAALPSIVERSIEVALTQKGTADRKMQLQHSGFLPVPAGSQTNIAIMQSNVAQPVVLVAPPRPEETIRRLTQRFHAELAKTVGHEQDDNDQDDGDERRWQIDVSHSLSFPLLPATRP
jgi:hypothetical protein